MDVIILSQLFNGLAVFSSTQLFISALQLSTFALTICTSGIFICNLCLLVDCTFSFALPSSICQQVFLVRNLGTVDK